MSSERLEMEIVGKNSTAKGWDKVESDAMRRAKKIRDGINRDGGLSGNVAGKSDKSMQGKGFMEVFSKALRGDISGAIEDLQERLGAGMKNVAAKATVWGAGIATAFFAGWKGGQQLDQIFGISDKIAAKLARDGVQIDKVLGAQAASWKQLRIEAEKTRDAAQKAVDYYAELLDIRAKNQADLTGTPQAQLEYEARKLEKMRSGLYEQGISEDEMRKRQLEFEKQVGRVNTASGATVAQEDSKQAAIDRVSQSISDDAIKEHEDAVRRSAEFEKEMVDMVHEERRTALEEELRGIEEKMRKEAKASDAVLQQLGVKAAELQKIIDKGNAANAAVNKAILDPEGRKAAANAAKEDARNKKRIEGRLGEWAVAEQRGTKIPKWQRQALVDAQKAKAGQAAQAQMNNLQQQAARAQIKAQEDIEKMRVAMENLNKELQQALTMGGAVGG